ncbi:MAG: hypothetical protein LBB22_05780, partial [Treponema sp.]|nr:hypothetical protein [Treponema sp.]
MRSIKNLFAPEYANHPKITPPPPAVFYGTSTFGRLRFFPRLTHVNSQDTLILNTLRLCGVFSIYKPPRR